MSEVERLTGGTPIPVNCPRCGHQFEVPVGLAAEGGKVKCPECGEEGNVQSIQRLESFLQTIKKDTRKPKRIRFRL